jgi:hypothetical protein
MSLMVASNGARHSTYKQNRKYRRVLLIEKQRIEKKTEKE